MKTFDELPRVLIFIDDDKVATPTVKEKDVREWAIARVNELEAEKSEVKEKYLQLNQNPVYKLDEAIDLCEIEARINELKTLFNIKEEELGKKSQKKDNVPKYIRKGFIEKTSTLEFKNQTEKLSMESNQITPLKRRN